MSRRAFLVPKYNELPLTLLRFPRFSAVGGILLMSPSAVRSRRRSRFIDTDEELLVVSSSTGLTRRVT